MAGNENQQQPLNQPNMTVLSGRPIKVLYMPDSDILVACRTAAGEDCYVPLSVLFTRFGQDMAKKIRTSVGIRG